MNPYNEDQLIEQTAIQLFQELGYEYQYCYNEKFGETNPFGRENPGEVILKKRLIQALHNLNPQLTHEQILLAIEAISSDKSTLSMINANKEVYKMLKDGVKIFTKTKDNIEEEITTVRVIDFDNPDNNDFLVTSQFWITGDLYKRRSDLICFINGIPFVFIELKAIHRNLERAFNENINDYKNTIPQAFWYNSFIIISNGSQSRVGSVTSDWGHFAEWNKINNEGEQGIVSLVIQ